MKTSQFSRRNFLKSTSLASGLLLLPSGVFAAGDEKPAMEKKSVNVACVGVGGMGWGDLNGVAAAGANIVAVCDIDEKKLKRAAKKFPNAKVYSDYRKMLDEMDKEIDGVVVSTPDHTHFTAAMTAVMLGKHVYVQKPMCHSVDQVRRLTAEAAKQGVVSQMGNQGHSQAHIRVAKEWFEAGLLGDIKEIHAWTNRPIWPQGMKEFNPAKPVPTGVDWDLWQGPAAAREYRDGLHSFNWRGYYDYGCGALGDMAVHIFDPANYVLELGMPTKVEVEIDSDKSSIAYPTKCKLVYHFPGNDKRGPVKIIWKEGKDSRPEPIEGLGSFTPTDKKNPDKGGTWQLPVNGSLFFGSKATAYLGSWGETFEISDKKYFEEIRSGEKAPKRKYPRIKGTHYKNWVEAILTGGEASSNFNYAGPFTQMVLIGTIAQRLGRTLEWDAKAGKFVNDREADALLVAPPSRKGFLA